MMKTATTVAQLSDALGEWVAAGEPYAFVPTMGALHAGHVALVRHAQQAYRHVVVSIFVNPTQFDRAADLERYPRREAADAALLEEAGVGVLFLPSADVVYPAHYVTPPQPGLGGLDLRYEGAMRPGHFAGVIQVVRRLVQLVRPAAMFLGQKDAQQVAVLRRAAAEESWNLDIVTVPTVREPSGLAMSSRNRQLSPQGLSRASTLHAVLRDAARALRGGTPPSVVSLSAKRALSDAGMDPEYLDCVDPESLTPVGDDAASIATGPGVLLVAAAWIEGVRLIDNLRVGGPDAPPA